jgi:DedD protein
MAKAAPARVGLRFLDRLILFTAWLVTCGLVYGLGFYTGKGTQERRLGMEERVVRLPVTSEVPAEGQRPKAATEFTFYETLVTGDRAGRDGGHVPKPAAAASGPTAAAPMPGTMPPRAATPPPTMPPPARPATGATPTKPTGTAARPVPVPAPTGAVAAHGDAATPTTVAATGTPPSTALPRLQVATAKPEPPKPAVKRGFTVEASPTRDRAAADALLSSLRGKGYQATLVSVRRDGDTWYRLRIGRYPTSEQASEVMRKLRERDGVSHAFVAAE